METRTTPPFAKITISRSCTSARAYNVTSWLAGRSMWVRSNPSDSSSARQAEEYHDMISFAGQLYRLGRSCSSLSVFPIAEPGGKPHLGMVSECRLQLIECHVDPSGIDLRAPRALVPRRTRELADHRHQCCPRSGCSGSTRPAFFSSTADSWAARRASAWCSSKSTGSSSASAGCDGQRAAALGATVSSRIDSSN